MLFWLSMTFYFIASPGCRHGATLRKLRMNWVSLIDFSPGIFFTLNLSLMNPLNFLSFSI
jgi:hypothetical protein